MNSKIKDLHVLAMYMLAFIGLLQIVLSDIQNIDSIWFNLLLTLFWLFSFTLRNLFIYKTDKNRRYSLVSYAAEMLVLFILVMSGAGTSTRLLFCITTADSFIAWGAAYGTAFATTALVLYSTQFYKNSVFGIKNMLTVFFKEAPVFMLTGLVAYLLGRVLKSNILVEESMKEAEVREVELKAAYDELNMAYENLEEMSAVKERNRIAREIHDTVGHTLTTVIVEMEASRMLASNNPKTAEEKFLMAQKQAVKALNELRSSVRLLTDVNKRVNTRQAIMDVLEETEKHAGVNIKSMIDIPEELDEKKAGLIVRALKEGLANGIRHGGGTAFFFRVSNEKDCLHFQLQDNGRGCTALAQGFGLDNMKKGIVDEGGSIDFISQEGEGFEIKIILPL